MLANEIVLSIKQMERSIVNHPYVEDAVVLSVGERKGGYKLKAFVKPSSEDTEVIDSIKSYCYNQSGNLMLEVVIKDIPRTPSGKVVRQRLLQMA